LFLINEKSLETTSNATTLTTIAFPDVKINNTSTESPGTDEMTTYLASTDVTIDDSTSNNFTSTTTVESSSTSSSSTTTTVVANSRKDTSKIPKWVRNAIRDQKLLQLVV